MRTTGSPELLEYRRQLAVQRVADGYSIPEVADFLGVDANSVRRWCAACAQHGPAALTARPVSGRPPKLTTTQEKVVCRWLAEKPTAFGFATDLWSAPRLRLLIEQEFGIHFHPHYLACWLRQRGYTPQKPQRVPRERNEPGIRHWLAEDWPRIKKKPGGGALRSGSWTRADC